MIACVKLLLVHILGELYINGAEMKETQHVDCPAGAEPGKAQKRVLFLRDQADPRKAQKRCGRNAFGEKNSGEVDALGNVLYRSEKEKLSRHLRCLAEAGGGPSSNNLEEKKSIDV